MVGLHLIYINGRGHNLRHLPTHKEKQEEAKKRVEGKPKTRFTLTEEQEKTQNITKTQEEIQNQIAELQKQLNKGETNV